MKAFFYIILVIFLCLSSAQAFAAEKSNKPYKATTVDECIHEKECFWHHLLLAVQSAPAHQQATDRINVKKWQKPIRYRRMGKSEEISGDFVTGLVNQILPYFSESFTANQKYNYLIVITDSIETELSGTFKDVFDELAGAGVVLKTYREYAKPNSKKCHYLQFQDPKKHLTNHTYFAFIEKDHPDIKKCFKEVVYTGFGLADISYSPIVKSRSDPYSYTKLELLLIYYISQDFIRPGMPYDHFKKTFDTVYDRFIEAIEKAGVLNADRQRNRSSTD